MVAIDAAYRILKQAAVFGLRHLLGFTVFMIKIDVFNDNGNLAAVQAPGMQFGEAAAGKLNQFNIVTVMGSQNPEPRERRRYLCCFKRMVDGAGRQAENFQRELIQETDHAVRTDPRNTVLGSRARLLPGAACCHSEQSGDGRVDLGRRWGR